MGIGQACAVAPGLSRSGTTITSGIISGVRRDVMAQFSFLMVIVPIVGEQCLSLLDVATGAESFGDGVGAAPLLLGSIAAFLSGLFACRVMVDLVKKARLSWFALYCAIAAVLIFIFL